MINMSEQIISPDGRYIWIDNNWVELPSSAINESENEQRILINDSVVKGNLTQIINDSESMERATFSARAQEQMVKLQQALEAGNESLFLNEFDVVLKLTDNSVYAEIFADLFDFEKTRKFENYFYICSSSSIFQGPQLKKIFHEGNQEQWKRSVKENLRSIDRYKIHLFNLSKISGAKIPSLERRNITWWAVSEKYLVLHDAIEHLQFEMNLVYSLNFFRNSSKKRSIMEACVNDFKQTLRNFSAEFGNFRELSSEDPIRQMFDDMLVQLKGFGNVSRNRGTFMVGIGFFTASLVPVAISASTSEMAFPIILCSIIPLTYLYRAKMFLSFRKVVI